MDEQQVQEAPFDSVWATADPGASPSGLEQLMLSDDKLLVVFVVLMLIWLGIVYFILRTDRRLSALEQRISGTSTESQD